MQGVQGAVGVTPDITVLAKSISNGYPMGAVVGSRAAMEPAGRMFISSTYWSDSIGMAAALTTIRELRRRDTATYLRTFGERLQRAVNESARQAGLSVECGGLPVHPHLHFDAPDAATRKKLATLYIQEMAKRGCHGYASFYLNGAQGDAELEQTAVAAREVFEILRRGLEANSLDGLLECPLQDEPFRRLVR
jgi:glutamate-1-semialdehyde 2,1-aminomutase